MTMRVEWLLQSAAGQPALRAGIPPAGMLCPAEQALFGALHSAKRRGDWLLGRWTAKRLVQAVVQRSGHSVALDRILIANRPTGEPTATLLDDPAVPLTLSLSHAHGLALCAVLPAADRPLGIDLEQVAVRPATFAGDYFTPAEQALLAAGPPAQRDLHITAIWSAKEAVLKALHKGLSVDTRAVSCLIAPAAQPPHAWQPFALALDANRLSGRPLLVLAGWWRVAGPFVMTLAAETV